MVAIAFVVVTLIVLGLAGFLNSLSAAAVSLGFCVITARVRCDVAFSHDCATVVSWLRARLRDGYCVLFVIALLMAAQAVMRGLRCPPLSWDSLVYHMFLPARWIQLGGLEPFAAAGGMDCARAFPCHFELLVAWVCLPFGSDLFANVINLPIILTAGLAAYAICREFNVRPRLAIWPVVFFGFSPTIWALATTQYVDALVAATLMIGTLFVLRYVRTNALRDVLFSAASFGLAVGTKHTALPTSLFVLGCLAVVVLFNLRGRRSKRVLLTAFMLAFVLGGYQYVRNWVELDNPAYPWPVKIAGHEVFDASPLVVKDQGEQPVGTRSHDWAQIVLLFSSQPLCWGPKYALLLPLAILALVGRHRRAFAMRLLTIIGLLTLLIFFAGDSAGSASMRRRWPETSMRMFAAQIGLLACAATYVLNRLSWPRWIVAVPPTLLLLLDWQGGGYSHPLHAFEMVAIGLFATACLLGVGSESFAGALLRHLRKPFIVAAVMLIAVTAAAVGAQRLSLKRDAARYHHYAHSVDYHEFPRDLVDAWQACDEPERPHVIAYAGERDSHDDTGLVVAVSRWFWYPLLGSRWQNLAVYASLYEERDIPSKRYRAAMADGYDEHIWLWNLARLNVDRVLLVVGEEPEGQWLADRPDVFHVVKETDKFRLYAVDRGALAEFFSRQLKS